MIYTEFQIILVPKDIRKQSLKSLIKTNFKTILLSVMVINSMC